MTKPIVALIQARVNSTRLPGKVLLDVEGKPMIQRVFDRARQAKQVDQVVVVTSTEKSDDALADYCKENAIPHFRGSEQDVLDRFYQCAKELQPRAVVRLTADCPLLDPEVIDKAIQEFDKTSADYISNTECYTYPEGLDTEVFTFESLEKAWKEANKPADREHVTPYIRHSGKFTLKDFRNDEDLSSLGFHWSVDKENDLAFAREVYKAFQTNPHFRLADVLKLLNEKPTLKEINADQIINEGLYKSLYSQAKAGSAKKLTLDKSEEWYKRSSNVIPGCAQTFSKSAFQFVRGVSPLFLARGKGPKCWDVDGNEYIDYIQGLLANIVGYANEEVNRAVAAQTNQGHSFSLAHPLEVKLAEKLVEIIPCAEAVRFGKNGSDATSGAIRAARAYTGREHVLTCGYHGWQDWYIGSTTRHQGVPEGVRKLTHSFPYNDLTKLENLFAEFKDQVAAVILEPFSFIEPQPGYFEGLQKITHENGALLIFDEVITGQMFGLGGMQKVFGITPDLAAFGKSLGNGYPISAVVGKKEIMNVFEEIFFSFTAGGETASIAAALKVIEILETTDALKNIETQGRILQTGFNALAKEAGLGDRFKCIGRPQWSLLQFKDEDGKDSFLERSLFQQEAVKRGLLQLATHNISSTHTSETTQKTLEIYAEVFKTLSQWLSDPTPQIYLEGKMIQPVFRVR